MDISEPNAAWDADWEFAQAGLVEEARLHNAGKCPKDPHRCYTCYVEQLERENKTEQPSS